MRVDVSVVGSGGGGGSGDGGGGDGGDDGDGDGDGREKYICRSICLSLPSKKHLSIISYFFDDR